MKYAVVDIDDTLINTKMRNHAVWRYILGRDIPVEDVVTMGARQIFEKHATTEERSRMKELHDRYWASFSAVRSPA